MLADNGLDFRDEDWLERDAFSAFFNNRADEHDKHPDAALHTAQVQSLVQGLLIVHVRYRPARRHKRGNDTSDTENTTMVRLIKLLCAVHPQYIPR